MTSEQKFKRYEVLMSWDRAWLTSDVRWTSALGGGNLTGTWVSGCDRRPRAPSGAQVDRAPGAAHGAGLIVYFGDFSLIFLKSDIEIYQKGDICPREWTRREAIGLKTSAFMTDGGSRSPICWFPVQIWNTERSLEFQIKWMECLGEAAPQGEVTQWQPCLQPWAKALS